MLATAYRRAWGSLAVGLAAGLSLAPLAPQTARGFTADGGPGVPVPKPVSRQCPPGMACGIIRTAHRLFNRADPSHYCNYDTAWRPSDPFVRFIVLHDTETSYDRTVELPANPKYCASWHYLVRSDDGHVDQALDVRNIAWHAGNRWFNTHSIGIEQEGWASRGTRWFTDEMYRSTARLVRYLAHKYDIPLDRGHILGHDNVPADTGKGVAKMHTDPGPYWDWDYFMRLVGAPLTSEDDSSGDGSSADVVMIRPDFQDNRLVFSGCVPASEPVDGGACGTAPARPSSVVMLHTAPYDDAPLIGDPYLHAGRAAGTDKYGDWSAEAATGEKFVLAGREGDWAAIWFGGRKAWLRSDALIPARGEYVTPKRGRASIPVYGRPIPEPGELPGPIASWARRAGRVPVPYDKYTIRAGQKYVLIDTFRSGIYYAASYDGSAPGDRTTYTGAKAYHLIYFNHRYAFVDAAQVKVVRDRCSEPESCVPGDRFIG